jgi:hypothetical protein
LVSWRIHEALNDGYYNKKAPVPRNAVLGLP